MLVSIDDLLLYENKNIINRYLKDYPNNSLEPENALKELLKYFWLSCKHKIDKNSDPTDKKLDFMCSIHHEMNQIDDMWHTFLLFTKDYMYFCKKYFNKYIHHIPFPEDLRLSEEEFRNDFTNYLSYVYDNLGENTVITWFY